jgi:hypothetical protein
MLPFLFQAHSNLRDPLEVFSLNGTFSVQPVGVGRTCWVSCDDVD